MSPICYPKTPFKDFRFSRSLFNKVFVISGIFGLVLCFASISLAKVKSAEKINYLDISTSLGGLQSGDAFGRSVANFGDINNDSIPDLAIGAYHDDQDDFGGPDRGSVWTFRMNANGTVSEQNKIRDGGSQGPLFLDDFDIFGRAVTGIGDLDNDRVLDLLVGAPWDNDGEGNAGAIWMVFLTASGGIKNLQKISSTQGGGPDDLFQNDEFGSALAKYSVAGRTQVWVAAGAPRSGTGVCYLLLLQPTGVQSIVRIAENESGFNEDLAFQDLFCSSVAVADFDTDGIPDLIVGAIGGDEGGSNRGKVYILFMNANKTVKSFTKISSLDGGLTEAGGILEDGERFGSSVAPLGDIYEIIEVITLFI